SFRVTRALIDRLEDAATGAIRPHELSVAIPPGRLEQAKQAAGVLGNEVWSKFPLLPGVHPVTSSSAELILNRTWRPALSVTGAAGSPRVRNAGNLLPPNPSFKLPLRTPPPLDAEKAGARVQNLLEKDPPYGARVKFTPATPNAGWDS